MINSHLMDAETFRMERCITCASCLMRDGKPTCRRFPCEPVLVCDVCCGGLKLYKILQPKYIGG